MGVGWNFKSCDLFWEDLIKKVTFDKDLMGENQWATKLYKKWSGQENKNKYPRAGICLACGKKNKKTGVALEELVHRSW